MIRASASSVVARFARPASLSAVTSATRFPAIAARGMTVLSKDSAEEFQKSNYTARMAAKGNPMSPHVTVYAFPIVALSSITVRVTGVAMSFGALGLGAAEIVGGSGAALDLMSAIGSGALGGAAVTAGAKFSVAFPFIYHYGGGLRHLAWDNQPELLTNPAVEKASYGLFGTSLLLSGVAMVV